jgi:hypothetical protein
MDLSAGDGDNLAALSDKELSAMIQSSIAGGGMTHGRYMLQIEDSDLDYLRFEQIADGTWQSIGGALSGATRGQPPDAGNGEFDYFQGTYYVVLVVEGGTGYDTWGEGGTLTLTMDDLHVTGITFADADSYTATLTFDNELAWGPEAQLVIDNLSFTVEEQISCCPCPGDLDPGYPDCDDIVDLTDFTVFASAYNTILGDPDYEACADLDPPGGDGVVDLTDFTVFATQYNQPCP